jgi:hypothetical protein
MPQEITTAPPTMLPPDSGVTVRMYRPRGLGDCFLLAFRARDGTGRYMLIDCGIFLATRGGAARMRLIARDIAAATGNRLHVVVGTHEHWDHLSGFQYAQSIFDRIQVDDVWLAWTEDPDHALANRLREKRTIALRALTTAIDRLKASNAPHAACIQQVLRFHGIFSAARGASGTAGQMEYLRRRVARPHYCYPGEPPLPLPDVDGVRVYVLGPPEDENLLARSNPHWGEGESYERAFSLDVATSFYTAILAAEAGYSPSLYEADLLERCHPFEGTRGIPLSQASEHALYGHFFQEWYNVSDPWRRIEDDWLVAAGPLALKLDNDTNNTSLVLAIELVDSGQVLLFAADAQVGNWLSWHDVTWPSEIEEEDGEITGSELVQRTVLYKVGHHGSHNATLREKGLEMMQSPDLVAMMPVDQSQADRKEWAMPFPPLLDRLQVKTRGRILRADYGRPSSSDLLSADEWDTFCTRVVEDPGPNGLWLQYTVPA